MKKSNLICGLIYAAAGALCLAIALRTETRLEGLLRGLAGAGIGPGAVMVGRYFYWSGPKRREQYRQRLENKQIEMRDELKEKIRDKSGRYAYVLGLLVVCVSMLVLSVLDALALIPSARMTILYLGAYLAFQIVAGILLFNRIMKKY